LLVGLFLAREGKSPVAPLPLRAWLNFTNGPISAACAICTVLLMNATEYRARERLQQAVAGLPAPIQDGDTLVMDRAESSFEMMCAGDRLEFLTGRRNVSALYLVGPGVKANLTPETGHTLAARAETGSLFESPIHKLTLGAHYRAEIGERFENRDLIAVVSKLCPEGGVQSMVFSFREPRMSPRLHFWPPELAILKEPPLVSDGHFIP
jgi:hypothetical protein